MAERRQDPGHPPQPSWFRTFLMKFYGPADLGSEHQRHPLEGTRWDPELERQRKEERRRERDERGRARRER